MKTSLLFLATFLPHAYAGPHLSAHWQTAQESLDINTEGYISSACGGGHITGITLTGCGDSSETYSNDECGYFQVTGSLSCLVKGSQRCSYRMATHFSGNWVTLNLNCGSGILQYMRSMVGPI